MAWGKLPMAALIVPARQKESLAAGSRAMIC
jgi:hypothetical protein